MTHNSLRSMIHSSTPIQAVTLNCPSPYLAEVIGHLSTMDCLIVDAEHGPVSEEGVENVARAAELVGLPLLIRSAASGNEIHRLLGVGAVGIQAPHIDSPEDAAAVVETVKYRPLGTRGLGRSRSTSYGVQAGSSIVDLALAQNDESIVAVQIESSTGVRNVRAIVEVPGIDIVIAGKLDLSDSFGCPGETDAPAVLSAVDEIRDATLSAGKVYGLPVENPESQARALEEGAGFILTSTTALLAEGCESFDIEQDGSLVRRAP